MFYIFVQNVFNEKINFFVFVVDLNSQLHNVFTITFKRVRSHKYRVGSRKALEENGRPTSRLLPWCFQNSIQTLTFALNVDCKLPDTRYIEQERTTNIVWQEAWCHACRPTGPHHCIIITIWGQFRQHFTYSSYTHISPKHNNTESLTVFLCFWDLPT
jgi:hypothetical protein